MTLVRFDNVSLDFGNQAILTRASLAIDSGERLCLIGRNGAGKSTTLKLISGRIEPDSGEIVRRSGMITSELAQSLPDADGLSVREAVASGLAGIQALLDEYQLLAASGPEPEAMRGLEALHQLIDAHDGWSLDQRVDSILDELSLPVGRKMHELSGGWRRRVALATALVQKPDLLLLDEPTNHLDIVTIEWLESVVRNYRGAVLFITHDRTFLQSLATRILEIDRGRLTSWPGDYRNFLIRKEQFLEDEATEQARFDRKLEQEEMWIRQGIKARRTRNEGRVRALESMRRERAKRINREGTARIHIEEAERTGRQVIRARNIGYGYGERTVVDDFSIRIMRGDRIGILGNNGVGKTTLLKLLLKELEPQSGTVKHGSNLAISYFDQLRGTLDPEKSVADNVAEGRTHLRLGGSEQHIIGYLKGFLFSPARSMMPVKALSGGEHNRVILAKLFTRPANLLVLDEPTNDLDMETLEVLEDRLAAFDGTLLIVSHDRQFLDNVVTSTVAFEADGGIREYVGGYSDWLRHGKALAEADTFEQRRPARQAASAEPAARRASKLGYKEQRELERLPQQIEELEAAVRQLQEAMSDETFYSRPREDIEQLLAKLGEQQSALDGAMSRWAELEDKQARLRTPG